MSEQNNWEGSTMTELALKASEEEYYKILDYKLKSIGVSMDSFKVFVDRMLSDQKQKDREELIEKIEKMRVYCFCEVPCRPPFCRASGENQAIDDIITLLKGDNQE